MSMLFVDGEPVLRLAGKVQFGGGRTAGGRQMQNETGLLRTPYSVKRGERRPESSWRGKRETVRLRQENWATKTRRAEASPRGNAGGFDGWMDGWMSGLVAWLGLVWFGLVLFGLPTAAETGAEPLREGVRGTLRSYRVTQESGQDRY